MNMRGPARHWDKPPETKALRVALLAGELTQGGAEKQLFYMATTLKGAGVDVQVYSLTTGEFYEGILCEAGLPPLWFGRSPRRVVRIGSLIRHLSAFRPHIVQAIHAFTNPYAAVAAKFVGALSIGGLRFDIVGGSRCSDRAAKYLVSTTDALIVNSNKALKDIKRLGWVNPRRLHLLGNAINLGTYSQVSSASLENNTAIVFIGSLFPNKRVDLFLRAIALARKSDARLQGLVVGDGPERSQLEALAQSLELSTHVRFLGYRTDVPELLGQAAMLVMCSETEGCPNVILEALAAGVPVISTPAGDVAEIVQNDISGFIVPFDNISEIARSILVLSQIC